MILRALVILLSICLSGFSQAATPPASAACKTAYRELYGKSVVNMWMLFGYKDTRPARFVGDRHERLAFVQKIVNKCKPGNFACGFERSPKNSDLFLKKIRNIDGKAVTVQLWVVNSSVGSDDQANRENPFQNWQSTYAQKAFSDAIDRADIVFYNGHSRFGGGPDFAPPHLSESGEVDTAYYQNQKPGFTAALESLQKQSFTSSPTGSRLKVLGLFSCSSDQHFTNEIKQYANVGLISSRSLIYYADALDNSIAALSSLLQMRCRNGFNKSLHDGRSPKGMTIEGFAP